MGALLPYPFGEGGYYEGCGCKWHCIPQFGARYDVISATKTKVGFEEFTASGGAPKRFLKRRIEYRVFGLYLLDYVAGYAVYANNPLNVTRWVEQTIDPSTGAFSYTESATSVSDMTDPHYAFVWGDISAAPVVDEDNNILPIGITGALSPLHTINEVTPTRTRDVWFRDASGSGYLARIEVIVTLENEYSTMMLIENAIAALPSWSTFPASPSGYVRSYSVSEGICYERGAIFTETERLILPNYWHLSTDELSFTVQRMRYKVVFPGRANGTFDCAWDEVFVAEGDVLADGVPAADVTCNADDTDVESDLLEAVEWQENGEVFITNARLTG